MPHQHEEKKKGQGPSQAQAFVLDANEVCLRFLLYVHINSIQMHYIIVLRCNLYIGFNIIPYVFSFLSKESSTEAPYNEPYILMQQDKDDKDKLAFTIMIGDSVYCSVESEQDPVGHAVIQLLALYYVFHFKFPTQFRNVYFYLQKFDIGDTTELPHNTPRVVNCYHSSIQQFLVFVNSQE